MNDTRLARSTSELTQAGGPLDLGPDRQRLMIRLIRELAEGHPVTPDHLTQIIDDLGVNRKRALPLVASWTERRDSGDIVGLGVTLSKTAHQLTIGDTQVYTWCALDTLIIPIILDRTLTVTSAAPGTSDVVRLDAAPDGATKVEPHGAVITWPARSADEVDVDSTAGIWASFCHHSFYFPTRAAAEHWTKNRDGVEILTLDQAHSTAADLAAAWQRYEGDT